MTSQLEIGKLPPQAVDIEETVLGAIMLEKESLLEVSDFLKPRMFYNNDHQAVYRAISRLHERDTKIDIITVTKELKATGELDKIGGDDGGPYFISSLTNRVASSEHIEAHARILHQMWMKREAIRISNEVIKHGYDDTVDVFDLLSEMEEGLGYINGTIETRQERKLSSVISDIDKIDKDYEEKKVISTGVNTGLEPIDKKIGMMMSTELIVVGARPGCGKTSYALTVAINKAKEGIPVAFFSLEMSNHSIAQRIVSQLSGVDMEKIRLRTFSEEDKEAYNKGKKEAAELPIYIDTTPRLEINEFRNKCIRLRRKHKIKLIIGDYIELFGGDGNTKEERVGSVSQAAKSIANELELPVMMLSQLSREVEKRKPPRPIPSDLRYSGSIEADADIIKFLYRPEIYGITHNEDGESLKGVCEVNIAKFRNGKPGKINLGFIEHTASFTELDRGSDKEEVWSGKDYSEPLKEQEGDTDDFPF